nr:MAG TPA: hypothetical protein [Caudoviricetes sp.]
MVSCHLVPNSTAFRFKLRDSIFQVRVRLVTMRHTLSIRRVACQIVYAGLYFAQKINLCRYQNIFLLVQRKRLLEDICLLCLYNQIIREQHRPPGHHIQCFNCFHNIACHVFNRHRVIHALPFNACKECCCQFHNVRHRQSPQSPINSRFGILFFSNFSLLILRFSIPIAMV